MADLLRRRSTLAHQRGEDPGTSEVFRAGADRSPEGFRDGGQREAGSDAELIGTAQRRSRGTAGREGFNRPVGYGPGHAIQAKDAGARGRRRARQTGARHGRDGVCKTEHGIPQKSEVVSNPPLGTIGPTYRPDWPVVEDGPASTTVNLSSHGHCRQCTVRAAPVRWQPRFRQPTAGAEARCLVDCVSGIASRSRTQAGSSRMSALHRRRGLDGDHPCRRWIPLRRAHRADADRAA